MKVPNLFRPEKDCDKTIERLLKGDTKMRDLKYAGLDHIPLLGPDSKPIHQTQDEHIVQFNSLDNVMASCGDYYAASKSGDKALIKSLRKDFSNWVVTSDRIFYKLNSLDARIVHYFGSKVVKPIEVSIFIPDYSDGKTLDTVLDDEDGLAFIQALFNTTNSKEEIKETLYALRENHSDRIIVWTPSQGSRKLLPIRAASLSYNFGYFLIDGDGSLFSNGRSRGVKLKFI